MRLGQERFFSFLLAGLCCVDFFGAEVMADSLSLLCCAGGGGTGVLEAESDDVR